MTYTKGLLGKAAITIEIHDALIKSNKTKND